MTTFNYPGFLLINKPAGITSYDCIRHLKRVLKQKIKIGHAGTLDPFASGLMIIAIGRQATRCIDQFASSDKTYRATGTFGTLTDTLDHTGTVLQTCSLPKVSKHELEAIVTSLHGNHEQTPPHYSALKHQGRPLYELARQQKMSIEELDAIVKAKTRTITVRAIHLESFVPPDFSLSMTVSKGTYVRSLVNTLAQRVGSCATTTQLERTAIGSYTLDHAVDLADIETVDDIVSKDFR